MTAELYRGAHPGPRRLPSVGAARTPV